MTLATLGWSEASTIRRLDEGRMMAVPSAHPHFSEPVNSETGFSVELWTDWLVPPSTLPNYQAAAGELPILDHVVDRITICGRVTVHRTVLWVCVTATGPGTVDDEVWVQAEDFFRRLWADVHERALIAT